MPAELIDNSDVHDPLSMRIAFAPETRIHRQALMGEYFAKATAGFHSAAQILPVRSVVPNTNLLAAMLSSRSYESESRGRCACKQ